MRYLYCHKKINMIKCLAFMPFVTITILLFGFKTSENKNLFEAFYLSYYSTFYIEQDSNFKSNMRNFEQSHLEYQSMCKCRDETIFLDKTSQENYTVFSTKFNYNISVSLFHSSVFTCDLFNVLRRGANTKVIGFSLYGKKRLYYDSIFSLIQLAKKFYPDWIIRIYYDNSIDKAIICQVECFKTDIILDNVDFCNIEELPFDTLNLWNAKYMHAMTWRWLPLGDAFVDFMASRDIDSLITQRELDSVNVWMKSNTVFHVMRDHPGHSIPLLGGMWSMANVRDRSSANYLFKLITNKHIAFYYNPNGQNLKGYDQFLLTRFFSSYAFENSTTHDSFTCMSLNGEPWPSQRVLFNCFVGCVKINIECCTQPNNSQVALFQICPENCRPKNHQDWIYC